MPQDGAALLPHGGGVQIQSRSPHQVGQRKLVREDDAVPSV
jgi:hypothetical protein